MKKNGIVDRYLALTITLQPKAYKRTLKYQYKHAVFEYNQMFKDSKYWQSEDAVTEVTQAGNIHIHAAIKYIGTVDNKPIRIRLIDMFRNHSYFGLVYAKDISDYPGWLAYMHKAQDTPEMDYLHSKSFAYLIQTPPLGDPSDQAPIVASSQQEGGAPQREDLIFHLATQEEKNGIKNNPEQVDEPRWFKSTGFSVEARENPFT